MRFTARHWDGFTGRLLSYSVSYSSGVAELEASWFLPEPATEDYRASFALDPGPIVRALPSLRAMDREYKAKWDDLDLKVLVVESAEEVLQWKVYGGSVLLPEHPELRPWSEVWRWLEEQVEAHLPV